MNFRSANLEDDFRERRLSELLAAAAAIQRQLAALAGPPPERPLFRRLAVRNNGQVLFLAPEEIEWIEAAGNYVRLNANGESHRNTSLCPVWPRSPISCSLIPQEESECVHEWSGFAVL